MSRSESFEDGIQFSYFAPGEQDPGSLYSREHHRVAATMPAPFNVGQGRNEITPKGTRMRVGEMDWKSPGGKIIRIEVPGIFQRRGIASAMFKEGHRLAAENQRIPRPKHSSDRTKEGDAFARAVGGRLPRRLQFKASAAGDWEPA